VKSRQQPRLLHSIVPSFFELPKIRLMLFEENRMRRLLVRSATTVFSLCSLGILAYYGDSYWARYKLFRNNFAMSFLAIHRLKGEEWSWLDYTAWISFVGDGPPALKHPENYRDVPCTFNSIPNENPFFDDSYGLGEKNPSERFKRYKEFRKQMENMLPNFECKVGHTDFWITPRGDNASDPSWLIYRPRDGRVLFRVGHLN